MALLARLLELIGTGLVVLGLALGIHIVLLNPDEGAWPLICFTILLVIRTFPKFGDEETPANAYAGLMLIISIIFPQCDTENPIWKNWLRGPMFIGLVAYVLFFHVIPIFFIGKNDVIATFSLMPMAVIFTDTMASAMRPQQTAATESS
jgi:hypothetical protein